MVKYIEGTPFKVDKLYFNPTEIGLGLTLYAPSEPW